MYTRKTKNDEEFRLACRRASLSRKSFKGGRPKGWRKHQNALPSRTISVNALDYEVLRRYVEDVQITLKEAVNTLAAALIHGCIIREHPEWKPQGWQYWKDTETAKTAGK